MPVECKTVAYLGDQQWPSNLVPLKAAADDVGLTPARLREFADAHVVPHYRLDGGAPMFRLRELREWLARSQVLVRYDGQPLPIALVVNVAGIPAEAPEVPPTIRLMAEHLHAVPPMGMVPGVYFLCHADAVVYVGQSVMPVARIGSHYGKVPFDRAFILPCPSRSLDQIEGALIRCLKPRYNGNPGPVCDFTIAVNTLPMIKPIIDARGV